MSGRGGRSANSGGSGGGRARGGSGGGGRRGGGRGRGPGSSSSSQKQTSSSSSAGSNNRNNNNVKPSADTNNKQGGRGGGGGGRGSSRSKRRDRGGRDGGRIAAEQKRLDAERKRQQEQEALAKQKAEEETKKRQAELDRRAKLQQEYNASINTAITTLDNYVEASQLHTNLRSQLSPNTPPGESNSPLQQSRSQFESTKKKLKSDLKKCTAFVKKIKAGQYPTPKELLELPNNAIKTLNLTRYVEEVANALLDPTTKVKGSDVPGMVMLCVEMHRRYPTFADSIIPTLLSTVTSGASSTNPDGDGGGLPRRTCFRLLIEFILHGIITDVKPIVKILNDATGVPSEEGKEYAPTDANLIVIFSKVGGSEILGVVPRGVQSEVKRLMKEAEGKGEGSLMLLPDDDAAAASAQDETPPAATEGGGGDAKKKDEEEKIDLETPFVITLSPKLQQKCQSVIESFNSTEPYSRAVSPALTSTLHKHTMGAYRTLSNSYVATHRRLLKLEKRCEQDRLLQGSLSEQREKGLTDARSLMDTLKKSVETLSEALNVDVPVLEEEETNEDSADGKGIELWSKNNEGRDEKLGPFDDEETRSFYCDVPDLLSTKPAALLGLKPEDVEKLKERNARVYGDEEVEISELEEGEMPIIAEDENGDEPEEEGEGDKDVEMKEDGGEGDDEKDDAFKDTPHYKLTLLLEEELPEASRRDAIDELADRFCVNHGSNKNSRKRLYKTLFLVPRSRLDLLPYYSRFAAIIDRVYLDSTLVEELEQQMHGQARYKKNSHLESRLRTVRYLGELTKFRVAPPMVILRGLRRCLEDFSGCNIDVACCILEVCGRYLYRMKHTHAKLESLMETMMRIKKARNLDERHIAMITSAFLMVNPPPQASRPTKEVPPLEAYLRYLLLTRLEADDKSVSFVSKQIQRFPWSDPGIECGSLVTKFMLKACRRGRYKATKAIALLAANLKRTKPEVTARLIDDVLEEIQWFISHPSFRDHQRTLVCARLLGELYCAAAIPSSLLFDEVHHILDYDHDIPDALRKASENQELFAPRGNVSQTIIEEDEEDDEDEVEGEGRDEKEGEEQNQQPQVVPISSYSKFDPRVPSGIDPPMSVFRIKLVTTILETASSHIVTMNNKPKLEYALASLQRYLFTKTLLPSDVEFSVLDLFDALDSELKKLSSGNKGKKATSSSFARYTSWIDAHQCVVAAEKDTTLDEARVRVRVLAQAGLLGADDASISDGDLLDEDENSVEASDEEASLDKDSVGGESDEESVGEPAGETDIADDNESESSSSDDEQLSDEDDEEDGDEIDEAAAEAAYMKQLQDEEFESELRKLTMEALEKGKVTARSAGGKVSSQMPAAPQFMAKKPAGDQIHSGEDDMVSATSPFATGEEGMQFKLFKRGNKGRAEEVELYVPKDTNLARRAHKHDDAAAKERDILKARVLEYEAASADAGGNVYLDETKLQTNRNRKLTVEVLNKNFGKSVDAPYKVSELKGRGSGAGRVPGRGRGRGRGGGRLFNPGGRGRG